MKNDCSEVSYRADDLDRSVMFCVSQGRKGEEYDWVGPLVGRESDQVGYMAKRGARVYENGGEWFVVFGHSVCGPFESVNWWNDGDGGFGRPSLDGDTSSIGFGVRNGNELWWRVHEIERPR